MIQSLDSLNLFDFPFELNLIKIKHLEILNVWFQKISIPPPAGKGGYGRGEGNYFTIRK